MTPGVVREAPLELGDHLGTLGARPDEGHVAAKHVPKLGDLVDVRTPQDAADAGHPVVADRGPPRPVGLGVGAHGAQLEDLKRLAILAEALLAIERRAAVVELDRDRRDRQHR